MYDGQGCCEFRLADRRTGIGISCDAAGLFVDGMTLLAVRHDGGRPYFHPRDVDEINEALSLRYGLPIDFSSKMSGLGFVAEALNRGQKHELITGECNSRSGGPGTPTVGQDIGEKDFSGQRETGLSVLRKYRVLK